MIPLTEPSNEMMRTAVYLTIYDDESDEALYLERWFHNLRNFSFRLRNEARQTTA